MGALQLPYGSSPTAAPSVRQTRDEDFLPDDERSDYPHNAWNPRNHIIRPGIYSGRIYPRNAWNPRDHFIRLGIYSGLIYLSTFPIHYTLDLEDATRQQQPLQQTRRCTILLSNTGRRTDRLDCDRKNF